MRGCGSYHDLCSSSQGIHFTRDLLRIRRHAGGPSHSHPAQEWAALPLSQPLPLPFPSPLPTASEVYRGGPEQRVSNTAVSLKQLQEREQDTPLPVYQEERDQGESVCTCVCMCVCVFCLYVCACTTKVCFVREGEGGVVRGVVTVVCPCR